MEKTTRIKESSLLYRKIDELALTRSERSEAVGALEAADRLVSALYWVIGRLGQLSQLNGSQAPKLRHE